MALLYAVAATTWISLAHLILRAGVGAPSLAVWMEAIFVLVTAALLYSLLRRPPEQGGVVDSPLTRRHDGERRRRILEAAVEAASDSILITDARGRIEYVNPAFTRITGWPRDEAVGQNPRILKSGHQDEAFYGRMWNTLQAGRTFQGRFVNRRADGSHYTQEATITPVSGPSGVVEHFVGVARDVTERELLERQLIEAQRAQAVGQVISGVSHDFRNILAIVQAQVELARGTMGEGAAPLEALSEIDRATARGIELVRRLVTVGRSDDLERKAQSLAQILEDLRPALRAVLPESVTLDVRIPDDDRFVAVVNPGSIEQILVNLTSNARDALPAGGHVLVEVDREELEEDPSSVLVGGGQVSPEGWIRIRVRDDGHGMEMATLRRIFEPFYTTKRRDRGTGLGMPMVARLVRLHGGMVSVTSHPEQGTTVAVHLPAAADDEGAERIGVEPEDGLLGGRGQRVLLVEDEASLRRAQVHALERLGYRAVPAEDGAAAIRALEEASEGIDLVITDLVMPGKSGKDVYDAMGVLGLRGIPVIFMSGYTGGDVAGVLPPAAEALYLEKPFTLAELARKVSDALLQGGREAPAA